MPFSHIAKYETIFQRDLSDDDYAQLLLRTIRNEKLQETDWWCCSDQPPTQAQLNYRQALRDLPSSASPTLNEHGQLTNVTWPTKPE